MWRMAPIPRQHYLLTFVPRLAVMPHVCMSLVEAQGDHNRIAEDHKPIA